MRLQKIGASEGIRTLDTHVGNVMLYQAELRSLPEGDGQITQNPDVSKRDSQKISKPQRHSPTGAF